MSLFRRHPPRREHVRRSLPDSGGFWDALTSRDALVSLGIVAGFCLAAIAVVMLRGSVIHYRLGQHVPQNILARVDFSFVDRDRLLREQQAARDQTPRVYQPTGYKPWTALRQELESLPARLTGRTIETVPPDLRDRLRLDDSGALTMFHRLASPERAPLYREHIEAFVRALEQTYGAEDAWRPVFLSEADRQEDLGRRIQIAPDQTVHVNDETFCVTDPKLLKAMEQKAMVFLAPLPARIAAYAASGIKPTYALDREATLEAQNRAAAAVPTSRVELKFRENQIIVSRGPINERSWQILKAEQAAFVQQMGARAWLPRLGLAGIIVMCSAIMAAYVARYQPRLIHNHARAVAMAALLWAMLLLAQLTAIGTGPLYIFGIGPTLLAAMILAIAYDQRFASGIGTMHALLATAMLEQGIGFFVVLWAGVVTCCQLLGDVRSRSRLVEVGGAGALVMMLATAIAGLLQYEEWSAIIHNCLLVGATGLGAGFVVLGILPFIESTFRITTGMSLHELADASQPLLRRLQLEAPGTYSHSLQVGVLAEAAAEAIGADSLLCRVGSYYHDIGKLRKPDYFCENQAGNQSRHLNLSPNVSMLVIEGHVKDGVELAKEYSLPTVLTQFITQHHGTTLVEHFHRQAMEQRDPANPEQTVEVDDSDYRYPGPRPRSREAGVVMIADMVESATRAMVDPTPQRIEALVDELILRRIKDGQFEECSLSVGDLGRIEKRLVKTLMGIHHARMAYPSTVAVTHPTSEPPAAGTG